MPSLVKKTIKGRPYYYLVWSARVNGKPRIVRQMYLGPPDEVARRLGEQIEPRPGPDGSYAVVHEFGGSAALWGITGALGLIELIDGELAGQRRPQVSVGQYIALATINRCLAPTSKKSMAEWYNASSITHLLPARTKALESQRFWDAMNQISEENIRRIEEQLIQRVTKLYNIEVKDLIFDATNFFTFIDTTTPSKLAQRGHNKAKRDDLRQVSVAVLASADHGVPLLHDCYCGNVADPREFEAVLQALVTRVRKLGFTPANVTLVFDKGNNSEENFKRLDKTKFRFVGSLPPAQHKDLLEVPLTKFQELHSNRTRGVKAFRTTKKVFGKKRTVVVTWNPRLFKGQVAALLAYLEKKTAKLQEIVEKLHRLRARQPKGKARTTLVTVRREIDELLRRKELRQCFLIDLREEDGLPMLTFSVDSTAVDILTERQYGKNILFSNRTDWSNEQIVLAYRSQYKLEARFKDVKQKNGLSWWPLFHRTDQKIRVHALYCFIGLLFLSLLQRELSQANLNVSIPRMVRKLTKIQQITQVVPSKDGTVAVTTTLTRMDTEQQRMFTCLGLGRFTSL